MGVGSGDAWSAGRALRVGSGEETVNDEVLGDRNELQIRISNYMCVQQH